MTPGGLAERRMTIAEDIVTLVKRKPHLHMTGEDIAEMLYGQRDGYQRVQSALQQLVEDKVLDRSGDGVAGHPYKYRWRLVRRV